jgi:hypothetical protein
VLFGGHLLHDPEQKTTAWPVGSSDGSWRRQAVGADKREVVDMSLMAPGYPEQKKGALNISANFFDSP